MGGGRKASILRLMSFPWASSATTTPPPLDPNPDGADRWNFETRTPPGTVTQKYETEGGTSVKDEWLDEWKSACETT